MQIATSFVVSFVLFLLIGWFKRSKEVEVPEEVDTLLEGLNMDYTELIDIGKSEGETV